MMAVTPWNAHGYDLAKWFRGKYDFVAPVWLQIHRTGKQQYEVRGLHDVDRAWMEAVRVRQGDDDASDSDKAGKAKDDKNNKNNEKQKQTDGDKQRKRRPVIRGRIVPRVLLDGWSSVDYETLMHAGDGPEAQAFIRALVQACEYVVLFLHTDTWLGFALTTTAV